MNPESTMVHRLSRSEAQTYELAAQLAARLQAGDVIAIDGPLGAGKTRFVRGLAAGLGLDPHEVSSPTFVIHQEYVPDDHGGGRLRLSHLDGYRLSSPDDLETIGWDELRRRPDTVIAVEWAARFGSQLPVALIRVEMAHVSPTERRITISVPDSMRDRLSGLAPPRRGTCPICGGAQVAEAAPFCSPRCRDVDLGRWFNETYTLGAPMTEGDEDFA